MSERPRIRRGVEGDLSEVEAIQDACPEAAHWPVRDYLKEQFLVAVCGNRVAGFLVFRAVAEGESEILNLAVHPEWRRRGVARALVECTFQTRPGEFWLEVRASNRAAQDFYQVLGFQLVTNRSGYYENPPEPAVVMKSHS